MSDPSASSPHWLYAHDRARAAMLCDPQATARQRAADDVLRALLAANPDHATFRARLQDAMWTPADFRIVIDGKPFLHHVIARRDLATLLVLISAGRDQGKFVDPDDTDDAGVEAIACARALGWEEGAQYLHNYGFTDRIRAGVENRQTMDNGMLAHAVMANHSVVVSNLLLLGADPDSVTFTGVVPVVEKAIILLHTDVALHLIEAGATLGPAVTSLDILWQALAPARLREEWYEMVDCLRAAGLGEGTFKTPREMTAQELTSVTSSGLRVMDMAIRANDTDTYLRGFAALSGAQKVQSLCTPVVDGATDDPASILFAAGKIKSVLQASLWQGQRADLAELARRLEDKFALSPDHDYTGLFAEIGRREVAERAAQSPKFTLRPKRMS